MAQEIQPESNGLTSAEAAARLEQQGPNDPAPRKRYSAIAEFLSLFLNPLVLILVIAAIASFSLGEVADGAIIAVIVLATTAYLLLLEIGKRLVFRRAVETPAR